MGKRRELVESGHDPDFLIQTTDQFRRQGTYTRRAQASLVDASELEHLDF